MLQVKSFEIMDSKGVNELLVKYRLAEGAGILISNGCLCVPFEDGEEMNNDQKIIWNKEQRNKQSMILETIVHSQKVLKNQVDECAEAILKLEQMTVTPGSQEAYEKIKANEAEIKRLKNVIDQTNTSILLNNSEILRMQTNIFIFNQTIADLLMK